ncbi:MAG: hypothetical protein HYZ28_23695 [Myxococcales bacterium]|nr:hypothetical protein [Myxococcales bacterium]
MKKLLCTAALAALFSCARDGLIDSNGETGVRDIGAAGGTLKGSGVTVVVPAGALSGTRRLTIEKAPEGNPGGFAGTPVELGPSGTEFAAPVQVQFSFDPASLPSPELPELARVATVVNGDWEPLPDGAVDAAAGTVSGTTTHFSRFGVIQICGNARKCPAGEACIKHRCTAKEICDDARDNDKDGLLDCADPDCAAFPACAKACCFDTIAMACVSSCCQNGACIGNCYCGAGWCSWCAGGGTESSCSDGVDNDQDGFVDCADPDCASDPACSTPKEICNNGVDDDKDGAVDCLDSDCASDPNACPTCCFDTIAMACVTSCCQNGVCIGNCYCGTSLCGKCGTSPEVCTDGLDNDKDGLVDCADQDCAQDPSCGTQTKELNCSNGIDDDRDGAVDCQDTDCHSSTSCSCTPQGTINCCYSKCAPNETLQCLGGNICGYPCTCVPSSADAGVADAGSALSWYTTCGDPVCRGWTAKAGVPLCTTEKEGNPCSVDGAQCDPQDPCNVLLQCASKDPKQGGMCPISRARFKEDIELVTKAELLRYHDELMGLPLATYRYKEGLGQNRHLGFIIDGNESLICVRPERDQVDVYGYTSMAVAALKVQAAQLAELREELASLKASLPREPARKAHRAR